MTIFEVALESFIDMNHELVLLSKQIDWDAVESEFAQYYCVDNGRPSVPIRKMVGMMLLKNIYNLSDEGVVARWMENPYMQYFTGEKVFQKRPPMNPIDMTKFRKRIGAEGAEKIFKISLMVNAKEITAKEMKMVMIEPEVECISSSGLIVSALAFTGNPYDGHTLPAHLDQISRLTGYTPAEAVTDRGYRGRKWVGATEISIPSSGKPGQSYYQKRKARKKFSKRAGIEPVIGHLKSDHRMIRNFLKGTRGDAINTLMAAAAYNMRHWMNKHATSLFVSWLKTQVRCLENTIFEHENQYACERSRLAIVAG